MLNDSPSKAGAWASHYLLLKYRSTCYVVLAMTIFKGKIEFVFLKICPSGCCIPQRFSEAFPKSVNLSMSKYLFISGDRRLKKFLNIIR